MNELKAIAESYGIDINNLPDNLETTICKAILTAQGYDITQLPNNLTSTMLRIIGENIANGGSGGSVNIVKSGGTAVPNDTSYVEKVYFNTDLSVEEVVALLSQLTFVEEGTIYPILSSGTDETSTHNIVAGKDSEEGSMFLIADMVTQQFIFVNDGSAGLGFVGWNPDFNGVVEINDNVKSKIDDIPVGAENDKLTSLVSIDGFESGVIKTLEGDYEAVDIVLNEIPSGWKGTQVPNSGTVEKVYFNTNLTVDEVNNLLSQLTYNTQGMNYLALPSDGSLALVAMYMDGVYGLVDYVAMTTGSNNPIYFISADQDLGFVGWNPDFNGVLEINGEVIPTDVENGDPKVGLENDKLVDLISIEILENTIDLEAYLDNKQMPMSVKLKLGNYVELPTEETTGYFTSSQMSLLASEETYILRDGKKYYYNYTETVDETEIRHYCSFKYNYEESPNTITLYEIGYIPSNGLWQYGESSWT